MRVLGGRKLLDETVPLMLVETQVHAPKGVIAFDDCMIWYGNNDHQICLGLTLRGDSVIIGDTSVVGGSDPTQTLWHCFSEEEAWKLADKYGWDNTQRSALYNCFDEAREIIKKEGPFDNSRAKDILDKDAKYWDKEVIEYCETIQIL